MSSFTIRRVAAIAALALITPIGTGIALADQLETDGDIIDGPSEILFGDICAGTSSTKQASIAIRRQGNNNVFANNAQVVFGLSTVTGHTTVTTATPATITLPNDWVTGGNRFSAIVSPNVTVTAGDSPAVDRLATINYNGTGAQNGTNQPPLTRTDALTVKWNVVNCAPTDTTAPTVDVPANITAEATSSSGASVSYTNATATDAVDGPITPSCTPASGSTFALGTNTVTCTATDAAGNPGTGTFTITVRDTTAPTVDVPANITAEATSSSGASVSYTNATATDAVDGPITPSCTPASGSTFALGTNTVTCTATDAAGNPGTGTFTITVRDTTAPTVDVPANITAEATSSSGASVSYTNATATDAVDGPITPSCTPASGSTFALGTNTVTCTATDAAGNPGTGTFTITVRDTTAPTVDVPANITAEATSSSGASVSYTNATATDAVDGPITPSCTPASGSTFALGTNTVTCTATDAAGNPGTGTFTITVKLRLSGFSSPVDMGGVINTVKSGSTVPLKFKVFAGSTEVTDLAVVRSFTVAVVSCVALGSGATEDLIEETSTGGTVLRYDATGGQFIQNWQTPKGKAGYCYRVTMTTQDSSAIVAFFKLK